MGASTFDSYANEPDLKTAFDKAVEEAQYDYGHAGYTGTIAEKDSYVVIEEAQPMSLDEARALADKLIEVNDDRIDDKWGPAGAIPIVSKVRPGVTVGWLFFGFASS